MAMRSYLVRRNGAGCGDARAAAGALAVLLVTACTNGVAPDTSPPTTVATTIAAPPTTAAVATAPSSTSTTIATSTTTLEAESGPPEGDEPIDLLTIAQGAVPIDFTVEGPGGGIHYTGDFIMAIDGDPSPWPMIVDGSGETTVEFTLRLPAPSTFERIYIPQVLEPQSSSATFFGSIEVLGSASQDGPYAALAAAQLEPHSSPEETTDLKIVSTMPVQFVRVRLSGGINIEEDLSFLEFSEIVGNGRQEVLDLVDASDPVGARARVELAA